MFKNIKQKLQGNIVKKIIKKIFNFYKNIETIYPTELRLTPNDKILILAPHADDESIGCGGLLLKYASQCDVVCLTDGRYGDKKINPVEIIKIRKKEFESVMNKLGVHNFSLLGIEDTKLENGYNIFKNINFKDYNYICIPNNLDQHPDHKAVVKHIKKAFKEGRIDNNTNILMYEVWGTLALPNAYIDISTLIDEKKDIINMYKSQVKHIDYAEKILALNEYRGMIVNKNNIEAYFIINAKKFENI